VDNEQLKTEIVKQADNLAELALQGRLHSATVAWITPEGQWHYIVIGDIASLTMVGMLESVKAHIVQQHLPPIRSPGATGRNP
jgi:hypothetical protein